MTVLPCYAGIDGGGTKARMLVVRTDMEIICEVYAGTTNLSAADKSVVEANLRDLFAQAEARAGARLDIKAAALGTAGVGLKGASETLRQMLTAITGCTQIAVMGDMLLPLYAYDGVHGPNVQIIIAGTGSICYGKNAAGQTARSGGWGHLIGDEGGGYWLACKALDACLRAYDGRLAATGMTPHLLQYFNCETPPELISALHGGPFDKGRIARAAVCVSKAAEDGDVEALRILNEAASQLFALVAANARVLGLPDAVLLGGGVLANDEIIRKTLCEHITRAFPSAEITPVGQPANAQSYGNDAAWGAVKLAVEQYTITG